MTRVDSVIKSFNKMAKRLSEAADFHALFAEDQARIADNAKTLQERHEKERERALAIKERIEALVSV
jgi:predicted trehalose synthase